MNTALIVNDNQEISKQLWFVFKLNGLITTQAYTRKEAFKEIEIQEFDFVVVNYWIENEQMMDFVTKTKEWKTKPIVFMTYFSMCDELCLKELIQVIGNILENKSLT